MACKREENNSEESEDGEYDDTRSGSKAIYWVALVIIAVVFFGAGMLISRALWPQPEAHVVCASGSDPKCPWNYRNFHVGTWGVDGFPLCDGLPTPMAPNNQWQSPINLPEYNTSVPAVTSELVLSALGGGCHDFEMEHNAHTWEVLFSAEHVLCSNLTATWNGRTYTLEQFHFHTESENMHHGHHHSGEMHMVHHSADGAVLVIAVFLEASKHLKETTNAFLERIFDYGFFPEHDFDKASPIDPYSGVLFEGQGYYSYKGSFTTPPCTPDVEWISVIKPVPLCYSCWKSFEDCLVNPETQADSYHHDFRPIQPLNDRTFSLGKIPGVTGQ